MRRLFVLRPEPGACATVRQAAELGLDAIAMPLFAVEPLVWDVPDAAGFDALLLTSANAVRHGGEGLERLRALPVYAVGQATADAAREAAFEIASVGSAGAEQVLGSIDPHFRLLHLCGEERIQTQASQVIAQVPVYRSAEIFPAPRLEPVVGQVVAVHSPRAARRMAELAGEQEVDRSTVRVAAISEGAAVAAGTGWERCEAAAQPDSTTLLALAARLCDKPVRG